MRSAGAIWLICLIVGCSTEPTRVPADLGTDLGFVDGHLADEADETAGTGGDIGSADTQLADVIQDLPVDWTEVFDAKADSAGSADVQDVISEEAAECSFIECGAVCCEEGQTCSLDVCCTPECEGKQCGGGDGCGGVCGEALTCNDDNPCTTDTCLFGIGCIFELLESAVEVCDGQDNDCDALIDEDLDWKETDACNTKGVCASPTLTAECFGEAGWECHYDQIDNYESVEVSCDNLDNNCDGIVDAAVCQICEPCMDDSDCVTNICTATPDGEGFCVANGSSCPIVDEETGACLLVPEDTWACSSNSQSCQCLPLGIWDCAQFCAGATPVCLDGQCLPCLPFDKKCSGNTKMQCSNPGDGWESLGDCTPGFICVGEAVCVANDEVPVAEDVSGIAPDVSPVVAIRRTGGPVVVWQTDTVPGGNFLDIAGRLYSPELIAEGEAFQFNSYTNSHQKNPAIASFPNSPGGFVVVWQSDGQDGDGWGIFGQMYNENGSKYGPELQVNTVTAGDQENPSVATFGDGTFFVIWESDTPNALEGRDIYGQFFDGIGQVMGPEYPLNQFVENDQRWPDVANRDDGGVITTWTSMGQDEGGQGVVCKLFSFGGIPDVPEFICSNYQTSSQKMSVVGGFSGSLSGHSMAAWESYGQDPGGANGVFMQSFDELGQKQNVQDVQVNTVVTNGNQKDPAVAVLDDNTIVVVWETMYLDSDKDAVAVKLLNPDGSAITEDEFLVNQTQTGAQQNPDVAAGLNQSYVVVWSSLQANNNPDIYLRMFKAAAP